MLLFAGLGGQPRVSASVSSIFRSLLISSNFSHNSRHHDLIQIQVFLSKHRIPRIYVVFCLSSELLTSIIMSIPKAVVTDIDASKTAPYFLAHGTFGYPSYVPHL